jgi:hypothetical protein
VKLSAVVLARTLAYIELADLNPRGRVFLPDLIKAIAERYKFQRLPKSEEREKEGLVFEEGKIGNKVIKKLTIYDSLIVMETASNTSESKLLIEELLLWGAAKFDLDYQPNSIKSFGYVSAVTFYSEAPILDPIPALRKIAKATGDAVSEMRKEQLRYETINITIGHDPMVRRDPLASFIITRRAQAKFTENKYYSESPLPTDLHIQLLEQYERDVNTPIATEINQIG